MYVERKQLWERNNGAGYTLYLQDNSDEIEAGRRHPAIIICGGGGYLGISDREKEPVALFFLNEGFQAIVLDYGTQKTQGSEYPKPVFDLAKMILTVRQNAKEWNIDPEKVAIIGFSAGGHLCASMATQWQEKWLAQGVNMNDSELLKPNAVILSYPVTDLKLQREWFDTKNNKNLSPSLGTESPEAFMNAANEAMLGKEYTEDDVDNASPIMHISSQMPPVFLWHTAADEMVYVLNSLLFAKKVVEVGGECELHMFEKGPHGMSLGNRQSGGGREMMNSDISAWKELALRFLKRHFEE